MTNDYRPHNQMDYCDNPNCIYHQKPSCRHGYQYPPGWITYPYRLVDVVFGPVQNIFTQNAEISSMLNPEFLSNIDPGDENKE